eukprot:1153379-Pelagomonas_calceolata.AAC.2
MATDDAVLLLKGLGLILGALVSFLVSSWATRSEPFVGRRIYCVQSCTSKSEDSVCIPSYPTI